MLWKTLISFESLKFKLIKFKCMYQMMLICDVCLLKFKLNPVSISKWLKLFTLKSPIYFDCLKMVIQISICLVCKLQNVNTSRQYTLRPLPTLFNKIPKCKRQNRANPTSPTWNLLSQMVYLSKVTFPHFKVHLACNRNIKP